MADNPISKAKMIREDAAQRQAAGEVYVAELGGYVTQQELMSVPVEITARIVSAEKRVAEAKAHLKKAEADLATVRRALVRELKKAR